MKKQKGLKNRLKRNPNIEAHRRAQRVHLSRYDLMTLLARPITADQVYDHPKNFWFGSSEAEDESELIDPRDVQLHTILFLGLKLEPWFDEISKLTTEHLTIGCRGTTFTNARYTKNSTEQRSYEVKECPGDTILRNAIYMDPFKAVLSCISTWGFIPGPVFCDVKCEK